MTLAQIGPLLQEVVASIRGFPALAQENAQLKVDAADYVKRISALEADNASKAAALTAKDSEVSAAKAEAETSKTAAAAAKATADAAESKAADLLANPSKVAMEIVAKAGVPATARPAASMSAGIKTVTRAEFDAMSHPERNAFMRAGGKVTS